MSARRAWRLREAEVPWGVRLTEPIWMSLTLVFLISGAGAVLGVVAAVLGAPGVGLGLLLTLSALGVSTHFGEFGMAPRGLTFEQEGLRVHIRRATFLVPWTTITRVEQIGPSHSQMILLHVNNPSGIVGSAEPTTPRVRARVEAFVHEKSESAGQLMFTPWTGGLDGPTLARAIGAAMDGQIGRVN